MAVGAAALTPLVALVALVAGLFVGSLPTADLLARLWGVDLRSTGSGNPGANNALQVGGKALAACVLAAEVVKGGFAVWLGRRLGDDGGGALGAMGAILGNVANPWYRFRGGKGLGIAAGTLAGAWPTLLPILVLVIAGSIVGLRRSGPASLATMAVYLAAATIGLFVDLPTWWGLDSPNWLAVMAAGSVAIAAPKHWEDAIRPGSLSKPRE